MSNTLQSRIEDVGDALVAWLTPKLSSLSLVSIDWSDQMRDEPSYPCDPRTELPRVRLRLVQSAHTEGDVMGCASAGFIYQMEIWLQLRQTPGNEHQRLLVQGIDLIDTALIQENLNLTNALGIDELYIAKVEPPATSVPFTEQDHPLGDPQLRVSSSSTTWTIAGFIRE